MNSDREGLIIRSSGGFYYVYADGEIIECRARGLFRKEGRKPLVGDRAQVELTDSGGYLTQLLPRKNALLRPPLANIDTFVLVASVCDPAPNTLVLDKLLAIAFHKDIAPMLVVTKSDLQTPDRLEEIYRDVLPVLSVSDKSEAGLEKLRDAMATGISAFSGNTGVGKSSLLGRIGGMTLETGETSRKLGRGRHTTRTVELYPFREGWIADTPGFSSVETERYEHIRKEALGDCFPEFGPYLNGCRYTGCSHTVEKGCAVLAALAEGKIHPCRHESYKAMYEEAKNIKEWELK